MLDGPHAGIEQRVLALPGAIAEPSAGKELFRVWRGPSEHFVSLFVGDRWRIENIGRLLVDCATALSVQIVESAGQADTAIRDSILNEALHTYRDLFEASSGDSGPTENPGYQEEVHSRMARVPVANPEAEDAYEIYRGWADGKTLRSSIRAQSLDTVDRASMLVAHLMTHYCRAFAARDATSVSATADRLDKSVRKIQTGS